MKLAQVLVFAIALMAGVGAMFMMKRSDAPPVAEQIVVTKMVPTETAEILVATADLPTWQVLRPEHFQWQAWPAANVPAGAITRSEHPQAEAELRGMMTRSQFAGGEPLRAERLIAAGAEAGFMSARLPAGKRALAISIDTRGSTSAGGFIHPNDYVDIIRIYREEESGEERPSNVFYSETLLTNIRVLAIGQSVQVDEENKSIHADTATVELSPAQAEVLALAQRTGQLTLSLRSVADTERAVFVEAVAQRAVTVTAGATGGFSTSRFVVAPRAATQLVGPDLKIDPSRAASSEIASARWLDQPIAR